MSLMTLEEEIHPKSYHLLQAHPSCWGSSYFFFLEVYLRPRSLSLDSGALQNAVTQNGYSSN